MDWLESLFFGYISSFLQGLQSLSSGTVLAIAMAFLGIAYGAGHLMQFLLTRQIRTQPKQGANLGRQEVAISILAPFTMTCFAVVGFIRWIRNQLNRRRNPSVLAKTDSPQPSKEPIRVATIGPTFFLAGLLSGAGYWLAWLVGPLLARSLGMSPGASFWQVLFLGQRPELAWLLPLQDQPKAALILSLGFWLAVWWSIGNLLRGLAFRSALRRNHASPSTSSNVEALLPMWRSAFGMVELVRPGKGYRGWATWLTAIGIVLMVMSSMYLGKEVGGLVPWDLAIGCVMSLSWILNLRLRGFESAVVLDEGVDAKPEASTLPSWQDVEAELGRLYGYKTPERQFERPIRPPKFEAAPRDGVTVSPLVSELLAPANEESVGQAGLRLSPMQKKVLESLSLQGYVHLDPPGDESALTLPGGGATSVEDLSGLSERHQIVLAPEGSGKTTLAMLAAANHALIHAYATLMVTRSEAQAKELAKRMGSAAERSTLRWNLRLRSLGRDFASDLSQNIIPDVVVVSLHQLVTGLLDNAEVYYPFLHNVGLVVIDDVESYAGAVEIHAQFAFSRLYLLFRQLAGVEHLGNEMTPQMLILGTDSMKQTGTWAKNLCGVQAAIRLFPHNPQQLASGEETLETNAIQVGFRQSDLCTESGRPLTVAEIVAACETCQVSWHYRSCGDGRRHRGRGPLWLDQEPEFACETAAEAAVLILEGRWSEIRRELRRMPWAGVESRRSEIAVLTVCELEEEVAFAAIDPGFGLVAVESEIVETTDLAELVAMLPLPVIRPPSSLVVQSHLLSDLLQQWVEVKELVDTFKSPVAEALRHLNDQGMLAIEERKDVKPEQKEYELKVYVRALATSLDLERVDPSEDGVMEFGLYDKVRQVELISPEAVVVRSRSAHLLLRRVDANSAGLIYYPGRVFEESRGRFVVVGRMQKAGQAGAIEVEPALQRQVSSPRRFAEITEEPGLSVPYPCFEPELILLGRDPISVGLLPIRANLKSMATYRLNPVTGELDSRELHEGKAVQELFQPEPLATVALALFANPDRLPAAAPLLRFGEARLLATMLRFLLPLIFRDTRDHIEVVLSVVSNDEGATSRQPTSPPWDHPLCPGDGLYILDLHQGGNGTARAIFREGLALPLRLCRHFLTQVSDLRRLQRLYDHWGDLDEILADGHPQVEEVATEKRDDTVDLSGTDEVPAQPPLETAESTNSPPNDPMLSEGPAEGERQPDQNSSGAFDESEISPAQPEERLPWTKIRLGLISWLDSRLHPEESLPKDVTRENSEAVEEQEEAA